MADDPDVIIAYTDRQALDDGVLVAVPGEGGVNRVTRAVFAHFVQPMGSSPVTGPVANIGSLMDAIQVMLKIAADDDGWRTGDYRGKRLWLVPNDIGGLTLMFPDDY